MTQLTSKDIKILKRALWYAGKWEETERDSINLSSEAHIALKHCKRIDEYKSVGKKLGRINKQMNS